MPIEVTMPRLSDTMQQGTIVKWNVKEGQKVKSGDVIADIETDKATMELQTFDDGTVAKLVAPEGQSVPVGTVIAVLAAAGEDAASIKSSGSAPAAAPKTATATANGPAAAAPGRSAGATAVAESPAMSSAPSTGRADGGTSTTNGHTANGAAGSGAAASGAGARVFASPLAKKIAAESGVDLSAISGTGPSGRIVRKDVEAAARTDTAGAQARGPAPAAGSAPRTTGPAPALLPLSTTLVGKTIPLSNMRRVIAARLVESKQTIPHYQVTVDIDMDALLTLRTQLNEQLADQGVKLSVNDFLVRACALAMHQHPYVNSRWINDGPAIELLPDVNIGIAIAMPEEKGGGLLVATIRAADQIGLRQISAQSKQLAEKARTKGLSPQEMSDSTFTISNLGMFGVAHFTAIINPPNVAILAVGGAVERPVVRNGEVVPGHVMSMTMSSDHRVVDGAMAAAYLNTVKGLLEKPATLLV